MGKPVRRKPKSPQTSDQIAILTINQRYVTFRTAIRSLATTVTLIGVGYCLSRSFGKETSLNVNAAVKIFADLKFVACITLAGVAVAWAVLERLLRLRTVKQFAPYKQKMEQSVDPERSSSGLKKDGTTNPEDAEI